MYKIDWHKYLSSGRLRPSKTEAGKGEDRRNGFDSDLGRVIFCPAIRRMHDKTQVIPLSGGDTVLTRLTHSMQVMNVAESLVNNYTRKVEFSELYGGDAINLANSISSIVRTASLLHDIGNPPFGHFGEVSIQDYFKTRFPETHKQAFDNLDAFIDFTQFDGNAMGLRLVSKLQYTGTLDGLNLTFATMGAYLKYPNLEVAQSDVKDKEGKITSKAYVGNHKHGIFKTEKALFDAIVENCQMRRDDGTIKRHPLSFLVEAADSICYGSMDIEDAFMQGWYSFDHLVDKLSEYAYSKMSEETKASERVRNAVILNPRSNVKEFSIEAFLEFERSWDDGTPKENRRLILDFRVKLIGYLIGHTVDTFCTNLQDIDAGMYNEELLRDDRFCIDNAISQFTVDYIISNPEVQSVEIKGQSVINGLLDILIFYAFHPEKKYQSKVKGVISEARIEAAMHENLYPQEEFFRRSIHSLNDFSFGKLDDYDKLRLIVDFVASMTDKYSVELYQKLSGIKM